MKMFARFFQLVRVDVARSTTRIHVWVESCSCFRQVSLCCQRRTNVRPFYISHARFSAVSRLFRWFYEPQLFNAMQYYICKCEECEPTATETGKHQAIMLHCFGYRFGPHSETSLLPEGSVFWKDENESQSQHTIAWRADLYISKLLNEVMSLSTYQLWKIVCIITVPNCHNKGLLSPSLSSSSRTFHENKIPSHIPFISYPNASFVTASTDHVQRPSHEPDGGWLWETRVSRPARGHHT